MNHFSRLVVISTVSGASLASFGASAALNPMASNPNQVMEKLNPRGHVLYETARLEALDGGGAINAGLLEDKEEKWF